MSSSDQQKETGQPAGPGYETHELNIRPILIAAVISLILLAIALFALNQLFIVSKEKVVEDVVLNPVSIPLRELRNQEDDALNSYKIIDPEKGIYQIPVRRAMEILANQAYRERGNRKAP